jgi:hypothetical protein
MSIRSKVFTLPDDVKAALDKKLVKGGFSDYSGLAAWLEEQGYEISRTSLHRYGQEFESRLAAIKVATEQAQAIAEAANDEAGVMGDALTRLCQEKAFQVLVNMSDPDPEKVDLNKMGIMIARLNRVSVAQKKWMAEAKDKAKKAAETVEKKVAGKIDAETLRQVREEIYGIVG